MISDAFNSHIYRVRGEMICTKQIKISHICSADKSKSKEFLVDIILSQIFSMDKDESKVIIVNGNSTEKNES